MALLSRSFKRKHQVLATVITILVALFGVAQQQGWLASASETAVSSQPGLYTVERFVDGDTIAVNMNGKSEKIRFVGVDTPETHKPNAPVQCYGPAAAAYTKTILTGKQFRLVSDEKSTDRDRYGRLLRYIVFTDGTVFNKQLINTGHGFYYPYFPFTKSDEFAQAQIAAQTANLGVWGNCHPTQTDKGGYISNDQ